MTRKIVSYEASGNMIQYVDDSGGYYAYRDNKFSCLAEVEVEVNRKAVKIVKPKKKDLLVADLIKEGVKEIKAIEKELPEASL